VREAELQMESNSATSTSSLHAVGNSSIAAKRIAVEGNIAAGEVIGTLIEAFMFLLKESHLF
jgi:hypothetical protein